MHILYRTRCPYSHFSAICYNNIIVQLKLLRAHTTHRDVVLESIYGTKLRLNKAKYVFGALKTIFVMNGISQEGINIGIQMIKAILS
jgi:hypothetical protein